MSDKKIMRTLLLGHAADMGILEKVQQHEARLAARFIQQPTEEDLAAYGMAIALVAAQVESLMANAEPQIKAGEVEPAPIEVQLQPTEAQVSEGERVLWEQLPGALDTLYDQMEEDEVKELLSDTIVFMWQGMIRESGK